MTFVSVEQWRASTADGFIRRFGIQPEVIAVCPGRVNIIGEHTDYSFGFVFPAAISLYTCVGVGPAPAGTIEIESTSFGTARLNPENLQKTGAFSDYVAGAILATGLQTAGLRIFIDSNLPAGSGLSSSASLLVGLVSALSTWAGKPLAPMEAAKAAKRIENEFIGVPCGFMDQFAVANGVAGKALLLDCLDLRFTEVSADLSSANAEWLVVFSGLHRELASGGYAVKVDAVKRALARITPETGDQILRFAMPNDIDHLATRHGLTPEETSVLKHVCSENYRVHRMRYALESQDAIGVGTILKAGHRSLADQFQVSTPALEAFVNQASTLPGVLGIRLTGAGMGGSLVALVNNQKIDSLIEGISKVATSTMSNRATVYRIGQPCNGVQTWKL